MSTPITPPVTEATRPFEPHTSPAIDRANRLMALRVHPGFQDLMSISVDLVNDARAAADEFGGWDAQQIVMMKVRSQAAKEHHQALLGRMSLAISAGIAEARENQNSMTAAPKTAAEALDQGDYVRQAVLAKFEEMDDIRVPGSYTPEDVPAK
jgi:hypothetical protein